MPLVMALQSVLALLQLLELAKPTVTVMIHRGWQLMNLEVGVGLSLPLVFILALWAALMILDGRFKVLLYILPAVVVFPIFGFEAFVCAVSILAIVVGLKVGGSFGGYLFWLLAFVGGFQALVLFHWAVAVPLGLVDPFEVLSELDLGLFYLVSPLSPFLGLAIVFAGLLKPVRGFLGGRIGSASSEPGSRAMSRMVVIFLLVSVSLGIVASLYPYLPNVNPYGNSAGEDLKEYREFLTLVGMDFSQAFSDLGRSRYVLIVVAFVFQKLLGLDALVAVRFLPIILNPLLVLSVFFFALEAFENGRVAAWASFFTACGFAVTVGIFGGLLANLLGLSLILTSLALLFRAARLGSWRNLVLSCLLGGALVFTHPWTFDQYFATSVLMTAFIWYRLYRRGGQTLTLKMMAVYLVLLFSAELLQTFAFQGVGGASASSAVAVRVSDLWMFWSQMENAFTLLYGGLLSNLVMLSFAFLGLLLLGRDRLPDKFLIVLMFCSSVVFLVGDGSIKSRLLFNIPLGAFAAVGVLGLKFFNPVNSKVFFSFILLHSMVYLFRSLATLI